MRALVLGPDGPRFTTDHPFTHRPGEARVRVRLAGVCATDIELCKGYMGFEGVLGHEWVGEVEWAPDPAWVGRRVVGDINVPCGDCATCAAGRGNHCPERTVLGILGRDGAFAESLSLPTAKLHEVPDEVPDEQAIFVEPLAAACRILDQTHVRPSERVVVVGLGRLGQLCARVLALTGAEVLGVARSQASLDRLPAHIPGTRADAAERLAGADVVVDATGSPAGLGLAQSLVRPGGRLVLKTTTHDIGAASPTAWVVDELQLIGSRCGPFAPALRMLAAGLVDPRDLITGRRALSEGVAALEDAQAPGAVKVVVDPTS
jgi:alcohol dehydrogenase